MAGHILFFHQFIDISRYTFCLDHDFRFKIWEKSALLPVAKQVQIVFLAVSKAVISELLFVGDFDSKFSVDHVPLTLMPP